MLASRFSSCTPVQVCPRLSKSGQRQLAVAKPREADTLDADGNKSAVSRGEPAVGTSAARPTKGRAQYRLRGGRSSAYISQRSDTRPSLE